MSLDDLFSLSQATAKPKTKPLVDKPRKKNAFRVKLASKKPNLTVIKGVTFILEDGKIKPLVPIRDYRYFFETFKTYVISGKRINILSVTKEEVLFDTEKKNNRKTDKVRYTVPSTPRIRSK